MKNQYLKLSFFQPDLKIEIFNNHVCYIAYKICMEILKFIPHGSMYFSSNI